MYGFKPTTNRIPFGGQLSGALEGIPGLVPAAGPLGHSIDDLKMFMNIVVGDGQSWEYDSNAVSAPWQSVPRGLSPNGDLTIGVLAEDKQFPLHPPVKRALDRAIEALTRAGHKIVRLGDELDVAYASRLALQYFIYGPHEDLIAASGEPVVASVAKASSPMFTGPFPVEQGLGPFETIQALFEARQKLLDSWRQTWIEQKLDVVIGPGAQNTAVAHDTYGWPPYTALWNVLDVSFLRFPFR